jgi:hypothetical protein
MFDCGGVGGVTTGCAAHRALQQRLLSDALIQMPGQPSLLGQIEPLCCAQVGRVVTFCVIGEGGTDCCIKITARATMTAAIIAVTATIIVFLSI